MSVTADDPLDRPTVYDLTVRAWQVSTGRYRATLGRHPRPVEGIALGAGDRDVLSWSHGGGVRLWELDWRLAVSDGAGG